MSAVKMRSGQSQQMNYWMRARVGLQGLTLVALVAGSMALKTERDKAKALEAANTPEVDQELLKQKDKEEFEERLRGAEEAHLQESVLAAKTVLKLVGATRAHGHEEKLVEGLVNRTPSG
ncbi:hypothetical protein MD484_g714, partial [Candolleomyces efflorescens]